MPKCSATSTAQRSNLTRNQMILKHRGLVYTVANRWVGQCPEAVEDLVQIGMIGLIKAIDRFDQSQGAAFSSFAVPYIRGAILHHLRDHWGSVKIPRRAFEEAGKVRQVQRKMAAAGRVVSDEQAAAAVGISAERWGWIRDAVQRKQLATLEEAPEVADESDNSSREDLNQALRSSIARLPGAERRVLSAKFFYSLPEEAIARQERRSIAEVKALITAALAKIRSDLGGVYVELL